MAVQSPYADSALAPRPIAWASPVPANNDAITVNAQNPIGRSPRVRARPAPPLSVYSTPVPAR